MNAKLTTVLDGSAGEHYGLNHPVDLDGDGAHEVVLELGEALAVLHAVPCD